MTTHEASKILKMLLGYLKGEIEPPNPKTIAEAEKFEQDGYECLEMAIKALEQQPCEDCISRQAVIEITAETGALETQSRVRELPSVTPNEKTGYWIDEADDIDAQFGKHTYKCSECNNYAEYFISGTEVWWDRIKPNFCPNCGARMVSE